MSSSSRPYRPRFTERIVDALSPYQRLTRFARHRCESEQELRGDNIDEAWMAQTVFDFLMRRERKYEFALNSFSPIEFHSGRSGGPRLIDIVGHGVRRGKVTQHASILLELKFLLSPRTFAKEILADIFRVATAKDRTTSRTQRLVLVVGRESCWNLVQSQYDGVLPELCPFDRHFNPLNLMPYWRRRRTRLSDAWKSKYLTHLDDYLRPLLPRRLAVELVGLCRSSRDADDKPEHGMTARLWRITST